MQVKIFATIKSKPTKTGILVKVCRQAVDETLAEYDRMLAALTDIADGNIPREMLEQWQGLSEEAWYEQHGEYLQNIAQAIIRPEPVAV